MPLLTNIRDNVANFWTGLRSSSKRQEADYSDGPLLPKIKDNVSDLKRLKGKGQDKEMMRIISLVENDIYGTIITTFYQTVMNHLSKINAVPPKKFLDFLEKWDRRANSPKNISNITRGDYVLFQQRLSQYSVESLNLMEVLGQIESALKVEECEKLLNEAKEFYGIENFKIDMEMN